MPDVGQPPAHDGADAPASEPVTSSGVTTPVAAGGRGAVREGVEVGAGRGRKQGLPGPLRMASPELLDRIERTLEAERVARTPEEEEAIDRLLEAYEAEDANWLSVHQDPPADEPGSGARNIQGAGRAAALTEAEVQRNRAHSAEAAHSGRLSGGSISPETREIVDAYDRGEIDADEMVGRVIARHARQPKA